MWGKPQSGAAVSKLRNRIICGLYADYMRLTSSVRCEQWLRALGAACASVVGCRCRRSLRAVVARVVCRLRERRGLSSSSQQKKRLSKSRCQSHRVGFRTKCTKIQIFAVRVGGEPPARALLDMTYLHIMSVIELRAAFVVCLIFSDIGRVINKLRTFQNQVAAARA